MAVIHTPSKNMYDHLAFSDDSGHEDGRYNSLGLITFPLKFEEGLCDELKKLFKDSGINNEFKWQDVRSARNKFAAKKVHAFIFKHLDKLRVDILIWDMEDTRHKDVSGRDDNANIGRMYYHLVQNALSKRWGDDPSWFWRPDKQSAMDWRSLGRYLISKKHQLAANLFGINESDFVRLKLRLIKPVESHKEVFVQVADYFAGLGAYSYGHYAKYKNWESMRGGQATLFESAAEPVVLSNSEKVRFPLIDSFNKDCKARSLTVSLDSTKGFQTRNPSKPTNFWLYQPQHILDKAPAASFVEGFPKMRSDFVQGVEVRFCNLCSKYIRTSSLDRAEIGYLFSFFCISLSFFRIRGEVLGLVFLSKYTCFIIL